MNNNPINQRIAHYISQGRSIRAIYIVDKTNPNEIVFSLENDCRENLFTNPKSRSEFMGWWKDSCAYMKMKFVEGAPVEKKKIAKKKKRT